MSNTTRVPPFCPWLQEMKTDKYNITKSENTVMVVIHGLVSCLGILENALIIWVIGFRLQRHTVASVWVLNLALSDFLATLTLPFFTTYLYNSHSWNLGDVLCKVDGSIFYINMFLSAFLLAAISLDRFLLVVRPLWSQNHRSVAGAWKICALGWIWAVMNAIPYTVFRSVIERQDGRNMCYHNFAFSSSNASVERDCDVRQAAIAISKLLLSFLLPLTVIAGSYIQIGIILKKRSKRRMQSATRPMDPLIMSNKGPASRTALSATTSNQTSHGRLSHSFIRMVTFVIAAFALCWAPYHIVCVIEMVAHYRSSRDTEVEKSFPIVTTIAFLSSVLNPILYVFSCPHFFVRIRQSLGAAIDGLVEEEGELLMAPGGRSIRAHFRRKSRRDVSLSAPGSSKGSIGPHKSPESQPPLPLAPVSESVEDCHMENTGQESNTNVDHGSSPSGDLSEMISRV